MRKVMVTGMGVITPIGITRQCLWKGLERPWSGIKRVERFDASMYHSQVAGEVIGFEAERWIAPRALRRMDRFSRFSVAAAKMAVEDSGLNMETEDRTRMGCFLGSALGGVSYGEIQFERFHNSGMRAVDPALALSVFSGAGCCNTAIQIGFYGPTSANSDSCASGPIAIGRAADAIRLDQADVMVAGAAEAPLTPLAFGAFDLIRAMSNHYNEQPDRACRPFDSGRDGFVMGEGAAMLILESEEHARKRGAVCLAEVCSLGLTNDGHHMTAPRSDGSQSGRAIAIALENSKLAPEEIDLVSAHGSGTPLNDPAETAALKRALGPRAHEIPIVATKSRHGHSLGAAGAIEVAILSLGLHHGWMPAAVNRDDPDAQCDLNYGGPTPVSGEFRAAISNSFGFGGINACLAMRAADRA